MEPVTPTDPNGVTIGDIEVQHRDSPPSVKRGQTNTLEVYIQPLDGTTKSNRYQALKDYQEYAGEADYGNILGGNPYLREHPQSYWPVASHVVPVVFGSDLSLLDDFWGLIDSIDDSETVVVGESSGNVYRLSLDIVMLADIDDYADREALLAEFSPVMNQM